MLYRDKEVKYNEATDQGRVKVGDFTFDKVILDHLGKVPTCNATKTPMIQQQSLKTLYHELSKFFGRPMELLDVGSGMSNDECAAQVALCKLGGLEEQAFSADPYKRLMAMTINAPALRSDDGVNFWQM